MALNLNWRFWQGRAAIDVSSNSADRARREPRTAGEWEARLIEQGVSNESSSRIAAQLAAASVEFGRGSAAALLRGVMLTIELQACERAGVERNMRDVREVERLLGAFTGELEKLDEVLEVLAAYAQRMRTKPSRSPDRTLH